MPDEISDYEELELISHTLEDISRKFADKGLAKLVENLENFISEVSKSFSNSWLGYHSCIYYKDLQPPPPGEYFDSLQMPMFDYRSRSNNWFAYEPDAIKEFILKQCGISDTGKLQDYGKDARKKLDDCKAEVISILSIETHASDPFIVENIKKVKELVPVGAADIIRFCRPKSLSTCDYTAVGQGIKTPPHIALLAEIQSVQSVINDCDALARITRTCASHIRRQPVKKEQNMQGNRIFIGHGRSEAWRDLKDFLSERLGLPWDEFNRVPIAGVTNIYRLGQMLDNACFAFLIMTAEDELVDGDMQARMNVIHEAGLFQGRLGFERAIILLEEGCKEFSNINGLGQIRFPKGNIKIAFEQIRAVLEREEII